MSQARFEENSQKNITAVTSPTKHRKRSNIPRTASIAAGTAAILLILAFMIWLFRHRRGKAKLKKQAVPPSPSQPEPNHAASEIPTLLEIDQNSMVGPIREMEDRGRVELQDELSPTGPGIKISELAQGLPAELSAPGHSLERLSVRTEPRDSILASSLPSKTDHLSHTSSEVPTAAKHPSSRAKRELAATNESGRPIISRSSSSLLWEIYASYQDRL